VIIAVLPYTLGLFGAGLLVLLLAGRAADAATRRRRLVKLLTYFVVVHVFLLAANSGWEVLTTLLMAIGGAGAFELYRGLREKTSAFRGMAALVYTLLGIGMIVFGIGSSPSRAVYVYLLVAAFGAFGQLGGKKPMGFAIGAAAALILAIVLRGFGGFSLGGALIACAWVLPAALLGELAVAWLKHKAGIESFGKLLPGQGGILDGFDGLLVAAPVSLLMLR
jgi:CDP-diglyceride synthetase